MRLTPPVLAACVVPCVEDVKTGTALFKRLAALDVDYPEATVDGDEYAGNRFCLDVPVDYCHACTYSVC